MDTHYGKYSGPLAALGERWAMDGETGDTSWSNADIGEGTYLWNGPLGLSWDDGRYLMGDDFECALEEVDEVAREIENAQGSVWSWTRKGSYTDSRSTPLPIGTRNGTSRNG